MEEKKVYLILDEKDAEYEPALPYGGQITTELSAATEIWVSKSIRKNLPEQYLGIPVKHFIRGSQKKEEFTIRKERIEDKGYEL